MTDYHLYGIGAALLDTEIEVSDQDLLDLGVEKGLMTLVDESRQQHLIQQLKGHLVASTKTSGGSGANTVIAAGYFGAKTFYSCKVAADTDGDTYLDELANAGVDYHRADRESGETGRCLVMITPDAERTMNTYLGISEKVSSRELHFDAILASNYVYIEGYLVSSETGRAAAIHLREKAEQNGVKTALSLSDPAMVEYFGDGLREMIGDCVDLLFCNKDEALNFTGTSTLEDAATALKRYCNSFAITLGSQGALVFDGNKHIDIPAFAVKAIDTNGAGDMFAGAFLYALTHNYSFEDAGKLASRAAAQVVSQYGPRLRPEQHPELLTEIFG